MCQFCNGTVLLNLYVNKQGIELKFAATDSRDSSMVFTVNICFVSELGTGVLARECAALSQRRSFAALLNACDANVRNN